MNKPKGGRGIKAPYQTGNVRTPIGIKSFVERIINEYRQKVLNGEIDPETEVTDWSHNQLPEKGHAIDKAKWILRQKKSAKESLKKLLTFFYNTDVDL